MKVCLVEGCKRNHHAKGYCRSHYTRYINNVPINDVPLRSRKGFELKKCKIEGCQRDAIVNSHNLCLSHLSRYKKGKDIESPIRETPNKCTIKGCNGKYYGKGLCKGHYKKKNKEDKWNYLLSLKGNNCKRCKNTFHYSCYDFHHLDPSLKEYSIAEMLNKYTIEKIIEEIEKCELLCANCHRLTHYEISSKVVY